MKIYFQKTKTANLFHFISNLTNWHFSVRSSYKKYWIEKTGDLTKLDNEWLVTAENLFKKYTYGDKYWGRIFLRRPEDDVWQTAEKTFGETDTNMYKEIAHYFSPRFEEIWNEEDILLNKWIILLKECKDQYIKEELVSDLNILFDTNPDFSNGIKVVVLMCSPNTVGGGGANIGRGAITEEISRINKENSINIWLNFWHEIIHVYWESTSSYMNMLNEFLEKSHSNFTIEDIPYRYLIKEAVLESLFPDGILAEKYFGIQNTAIINKNKTMASWRAYSRFHLYETAKKYLFEHKKIDREYLLTIHNLLKNFPK